MRDRSKAHEVTVTVEKTFGERLEAARRRRDMTQAELCNATGIALPTISRMENDLRLPTYAHLRNICIALRVSADHLLGID
jgi:transcriptional regulator with XRE-family HTH domain